MMKQGLYQHTAKLYRQSHKGMVGGVLLCLLLTGLPLYLKAQVLDSLAAKSAPDRESPPSAGTEQTEEMLTINMRNADIGSVIHWIAEKTRKQIVIDPRVKGRVTILANREMSVEQAYQVFLAALDVNGFSAAESQGVLRIFPTAIAKSSPSQILQNFDAAKSGGEHITYVYQAQHVSAEKLKALIQPLIPGSGYLGVFADSNSLVMADDENSVRRLTQLLQQIDNSGDFSLEVSRLQHADAEKVAELIASLVGTQSGDSAFSIVSDERMNAVLMSGDPSTRQRVRGLIRQLDAPLEAGGNTRVVYLNYLDAKEVVPILRGMSQSAQEGEKNASEQNDTISIEASESANALVLTAPPRLLDKMQQIIKEIDVRRSQVLVEAVIVEVSKSFYEVLGVEWNTSLSARDGTEAATNFGLKPDLSNIENVDAASSLIGTGLSLGFFRNGSLRALIRALASENDVNILSTPSLLTLDNQEAEILVGSNVPFKTGESTGAASTTDNPFVTIERQDIGLTLKVTPQINQDNAVTLDILQEYETLSESVQVDTDVVTDKRSIKTKVLVEDGDILVLGGLISDEEQTIEDKIPLLGDVPLLGRLFKTEQQILSKRNLMVFINPVIMKGDAQSEAITRQKYEEIKGLRERYQEGELIIEDMQLRDFDTYRPSSEEQPSQ